MLMHEKTCVIPIVYFSVLSRDGILLSWTDPSAYSSGTSQALHYDISAEYEK